MNKTIRLIAVAITATSSFSVNALEKVEPVKPLHTNKAVLIQSIEADLSLTVKALTDTIVVENQITSTTEDLAKNTLKQVKAKVKTNALTIAE